MWNILKMAGRRAKLMKIGDSRKSICRVLFGSGDLSSVWGHSVHFCKISNVKIFKRLLLPQFSSKIYGNHREYRPLLFCLSAKA